MAFVFVLWALTAFFSLHALLFAFLSFWAFTAAFFCFMAFVFVLWSNLAAFTFFTSAASAVFAFTFSAFAAFTECMVMMLMESWMMWTMTVMRSFALESVFYFCSAFFIIICNSSNIFIPFNLLSFKSSHQFIVSSHIFSRIISFLRSFNNLSAHNIHFFNMA